MKKHLSLIHIVLLGGYVSCLAGFLLITRPGAAIGPLLWSVVLLGAADLALDIAAERAGVRNTAIHLAHWFNALPALLAIAFITFLASVNGLALASQGLFGPLLDDGLILGVSLLTTGATIAGLVLALALSVAGYVWRERPAGRL